MPRLWVFLIVSAGLSGLPKTTEKKIKPGFHCFCREHFVISNGIIVRKPKHHKNLQHPKIAVTLWENKNGACTHLKLKRDKAYNSSKIEHWVHRSAVSLHWMYYIYHVTKTEKFSTAVIYLNPEFLKKSSFFAVTSLFVTPLSYWTKIWRTAAGEVSCKNDEQQQKTKWELRISVAKSLERLLLYTHFEEYWKKKTRKIISFHGHKR